MDTYDLIIIGGGIVGLATARAALEKRPGLNVAILEKESQLAQHQSGRNSGVLHSGIYYRPGSLKARLAQSGRASMVRFCQEHGLDHEGVGKVIGGTRTDEIPRPGDLAQRAPA